MAIDNETLRFLGATSYIAASFNLKGSADKIAGALVAALPNDPEAHVVHAFAKLQTRRPEDCVSILQEKVLAKHPDHASAKAYLVLAHDMMGNKVERDRLAREVIEAGGDPEAVKMVEQAIAG